MSSPGENQGPPPEPPLHPVQNTPPAAPPPDADAAAAPTTPTHGADGGAAAQPAPGTGATPGQSRGQQRGRRPLSSLSFFLPFPMARQPEGADAPRAGMTWTVELFPNDGDEDAANGDADGDAPMPAGASDAAAAAPATEPTDPPADGVPAPPNAGPGPQPNNQPQTEERTIFFIIGPDGQPAPPPGGAGAAAGGNNGQTGPGGANFWFPFALPFTFAPPGPPAPDPAKAAELLASLPTIGRALLRRVDKIITAEDTVGGKEYDDRGWRCGICLDGLDVDADEPASVHPVKALPCNHLFHEECLQPWFTSHHTCPTCRLDLDPLRTLHGPRETRGNPLRPAATGSGRATPRNAPHPYARDRETRDRSRSGLQTPANPPAENRANANPTEALAQEDQQVPLQEVEQTQTQIEAENNTQAQEEGAAPRAAAAAGGERPAGQNGGTPALHDILFNLVAQATAAAFGELAQGRMFDHPMTASPTPMERAATAPPAAGREEPSSPTSSAPAAPAAEGNEAAVPPVPATEADAEAGPAPAPTPAPATAAPEPPTRPVPERRSHIFLQAPSLLRNPSGPPADGAAAPDSAAPGPAPGGPAPAGGPGGSAARFANLFNNPMEYFFLRPPVGRPAAEEPVRETPTPSQPAFVPQSLGSWTEQREKTLGWRCDAVECLVAAPVPDEDAEEMDVDEEADHTVTAADREMLSIYASLQGAMDDNEGEHANYVILACPHRWHRACLETAERSAGHSATPDVSHREWVRCQKCRKEGWITPRPDESPAVPGTIPVEG